MLQLRDAGYPGKECAARFDAFVAAFLSPPVPRNASVADQLRKAMSGSLHSMNT